MEKYDFEKMGGIWKDEARTITENGVFVANSGNWDLWEYSGTVYSIPVSGSPKLSARAGIQSGSRQQARA